MYLHSLSVILSLGILFLSSVTSSTIVTHTFNVTYGLRKPDCHERQVMLVNNEFPAPELRLSKGDILSVKVVNNLDKEISVHWHGLHQKSSPSMDGVPHLIQNPIPPKGEFEYVIPVNEQVGTYWYHLHTGVQSHDLFGAIVINDPMPPYRYDEEKTIFIGDWYHASEEAQTNGLLGTNFTWIGNPQSLLVNGRGNSNCSQPNHSIIDVTSNKTYRLRFISTSSLAYSRLHIPGHKWRIIEADGYYTQPLETDVLEINSGQRYSVLLETNQPAKDYPMNVEFLWRKSNLTGQAVIRYTDSKLPQNSTLEAFSPYPSEPKPYWILDQLVAHESTYLSPPTRTIVIEGKQEKMSDGKMKWTVNGKSWQFEHSNKSDTVPLLQKVLSSGDYKTHISNDSNIIEVKYGEIVDIIFQNTVSLNGVCEQHPWHMHGFSFYDLGSGPGLYNAAEHQKFLNTHNPIRRDTTTVYPYSAAFNQAPGKGGDPCGWKVVRLVIDNPGVWLAHCHIPAHAIMGMQFALLVPPNTKYKLNGHSNHASKAKLDVANISGLFAIILAMLLL
ncbi:Cupredoxin [Paraphysoderma sedebokerense]|nr:Cupredoxin [Paraphysoderma sedebokerense]